MPERLAAGLLDTSVVIDLQRLAPEQLPEQMAISAVTMAELAAGPSATDDVEERARRQDRLQRAEAAFDPVPFGVDSARAYGRVYGAVRKAGRQPRGRFADLLIAAVALAEDLPLLTQNAVDFVGLESLVDVVEVVPGGGRVP
ncbi:MAG: type II toxin-antitoxin system VapC family toxin [Nocardioidaceae bacterium]